MNRPRSTQSLLGGVSAAAYVAVALWVLWETRRVHIRPSLSDERCGKAAAGPICHHLQERTLGTGGRYFPVCARCAGIWIGWLLASVLWWSFRVTSQNARWLAPRQLALMAACLGAVLLAVAELGGWLQTNNATRAVLGIPLGLFAGWLLLRASRSRVKGEQYENA